MKMRKILTGVVAAAVAASTLAVGAMAATVERTAPTAYDAKVYQMKGTLSTPDLEFARGDRLSLGYIDLTEINKNVPAGYTAVVNAVSVEGYDVGNGGKIDFALLSKDKTDTTNANLRAGKYTKFDVTANIIVTKNGGTDAAPTTMYWPPADKSSDLETYIGDKKITLTMTPAGGKLVLGDSKSDLTAADVLTVTLTTPTVNWTYNSANDNAATSVNFSFTGTNLKVQERAIVKAATSAKVVLTLKDVNDEISIVKAKVGDTVIGQEVLAKGATSATITLDAAKLYDTDYDVLVDGITVTTGSGKIVKAVLTIDDGEAVVDADDDTDTDDDDDDDSDIEADDDDDTDDDDDDDTDDDDDDDTDDDDDDDSDVDGDGSDGSDGEGTDGQGSTGTGSDGASGAGKDGKGGNPDTGVALAVIPALVAGAAAVVARKRK